MAAARAFSKRDRKESDLLLNVVFAHMAFGSAKSEPDRDVAHNRFKEAVRILYRYLKARDMLEG
jgi:hypothetical protein